MRKFQFLKLEGMLYRQNQNGVRYELLLSTKYVEFTVN